MRSQLWHTLSANQTLADLGSGPRGLAADEATRRLERYGANELKAAKRTSPWALLFAQLSNVLVLILLVGAAISGFLGHTIEAVAIAVIVAFAVLLGFIQEYRAERAIEALKAMAAPNAMVIRDGVPGQIPARDLVPGDVILLTAGDRCPADARLLEAVNLKLEESALTGESLAVEKATAPLPSEELSLGDRKNLTFAGTAVVYGRGKAVVTATGMETEFGRIAGLLEEVAPGKTSLEIALDRVGHVLARGAFAIVAGIVLLGVVQHKPLLDMLIFGVALAVAVVPEALPAVVTISLALGVQRMARRHALVRRLPAVETLGSVSVICSDKTGTLTRDEMTARRIFLADQEIAVSGAGYDRAGEFSADGGEVPREALERLLTAATLASDARLLSRSSDADGRSLAWAAQGDPTEAALLVAGAKAGLDKVDLEARFPRHAEIPFTSEARRMTTVHRGEGRAFACAKGAPEVLLDACTQVLGPDGPEPLDAARRERILAAAAGLAAQALRVLAVADKEGADLAHAEQGLTFLGLVGLSDPPRPEAAAAVRTCRAAGIAPVMITGDHPATAEAIARELGILTDGRLLTGIELEGLSDEDLAAEIERVQVYARVSPAHKLRVITAWQARGHYVAMTGDGVNDAPALKKADVGIAMGINGTEVTREAAEMTLTDDNFASIVAAVEEGRVIFGNIKKYLMYLLSSNIGELGLMVLASLAGWPLPLTAVQLLYVNLATDGLPALALAVDPPDGDLMQRPPRSPEAAIFTRPVVTLLLTGGIWLTVVIGGLFHFNWDPATPETISRDRTMTFVGIVLIEFFKAYIFRSDRLPIWHRPFANKWLNLAILWELTLLLLVVYLPPLQRLMGTTALSWRDFGLALLCAATVVPVLETAKWWVGRRGTPAPQPAA